MVFYKEGDRGTIRPCPELNLEEACIKLNDSMAGIGTDERALTDIIISVSFQQRREIRKTYLEIYDRNLMRQIESELTFHYEKIVMTLLTEPEEFILDCINEAVTLSLGEGIIKKFQKATIRKGIAADEYTLMGLLIPRFRNGTEFHGKFFKWPRIPWPNYEILEIKKAYKKKYKQHLEKRIAKSENLSLDFRRLIIAMIDCKREEKGKIDGDLMFKDVMNLMGGKKEDHIHVIFHERSFEHLRKLFSGYEDFTGKIMESLIENTGFSLDLKQAYMSIVTLIRNQAEFFAERLHDAIDGVGSDDAAIIQIFVLRSEIDLVDISFEYEKKYGTPLKKDISGDTSGDYEDILLKMLRIPEDMLEEMAAKRKEQEEELVEEDEDDEEQDEESDE